MEDKQQRRQLPPIHGPRLHQHRLPRHHRQLPLHLLSLWTLLIWFHPFCFPETVLLQRPRQAIFFRAQAGPMQIHRLVHNQILAGIILVVILLLKILLLVEIPLLVGNPRLLEIPHLLEIRLLLETLLLVETAPLVKICLAEIHLLAQILLAEELPLQEIQFLVGLFPDQQDPKQ